MLVPVRVTRGLNQHGIAQADVAAPYWLQCNLSHIKKTTTKGPDHVDEEVDSPSQAFARYKKTSYILAM